MKLEDVLKKYKRVAVVGGPVTGKSIVTEQVSDRPTFHSDDFNRDALGWSGQSEALKEAAASSETFIVAGCAADRAVRKGLEVDAIIHCTEFQNHLPTDGQATLKRQIDKRTRELAKNTPTFTLKDLL